MCVCICNTYIYTSLIEVKFLEILMLRAVHLTRTQWNERTDERIEEKKTSKITTTTTTKNSAHAANERMRRAKTAHRASPHLSLSREKPIHMCLKGEYVVRNILIRSSTCASGSSHCLLSHSVFHRFFFFSSPIFLSCDIFVRAAHRLFPRYPFFC